jgi:hypothetical protein
MTRLDGKDEHPQTEVSRATVMTPSESAGNNEDTTVELMRVYESIEQAYRDAMSAGEIYVGVSYSTND